MFDSSSPDPVLFYCGKTDWIVFGADIVSCQPERISGPNALRDGIDGVSARDNVNLKNWGGLVDGNTHLPILIGDVVDINNSPDTVNPKFS